MREGNFRYHQFRIARMRSDALLVGMIDSICWHTDLTWVQTENPLNETAVSYPETTRIPTYDLWHKMSYSVS
jgi:hypothetical protein